jgi:hypothetical protein
MGCVYSAVNTENYVFTTARIWFVLMRWDRTAKPVLSAISTGGQGGIDREEPVVRPYGSGLIQFQIHVYKS